MFSKYVAVTPHDTNKVAKGAFSALYIGSNAGNVTVLNPADGTAVTFKLVPVGTILEIRGAVVKSTGTTSTDIVALYEK